MQENDFSYENLKNFTYIDCVQNEVTRHYGPVNGILSRRCVQDHNVDGITIKKDTIFRLQPIGTHYSEEYFKQPREFRPERWIDECKSLPAYTLGGFGGGSRSCIGKHLAKLEAKIGLIKFMQRYSHIQLQTDEIRLRLTAILEPNHFKSKMIRSDIH